MSDLEKVDTVNHSTRTFEVIDEKTRSDLLNRNQNIYEIFLLFYWFALQRENGANFEYSEKLT